MIAVAHNKMRQIPVRPGAPGQSPARKKALNQSSQTKKQALTKDLCSDITGAENTLSGSQ
ncbi:hypothetical protein BZK42_24695 [Citrobacter braakii]|uniref:Uncharacterized protein n=1 Tax=Citrobacter braakii TaxID=57706 RepID=A0A1V8NSV6_CITBR|nr:hypothetical protein BZK42_24695 [Citrobacter braakii]